jgi:hypothetical protein
MSAPELGDLLGKGDDLADPLQVRRYRPDRNASSLGADRTGPLLGAAARMTADSSAGVAPAI